eukprot:5560259-Pleurochrysis_carterae.AAC.1
MIAALCVWGDVCARGGRSGSLRCVVALCFSHRLSALELPGHAAPRQRAKLRLDVEERVLGDRAVGRRVDDALAARRERLARRVHVEELVEQTDEQQQALRGEEAAERLEGQGSAGHRDARREQRPRGVLLV